MPKCKACGKEIIFKRTRTGKLMPFDGKTVPVLFDDETCGPGLKRVLQIGPGYIPHWITCTDPDRFRKDGGK